MPRKVSRNSARLAERIATLSPRCRLYGVEPEAGDDGRQSLRKGELVTIATPRTLADGAQTQRLGDYTFAIIRRDVDDIVTVTDDELVAAMRFAFLWRLTGLTRVVRESPWPLAFGVRLRSRSCLTRSRFSWGVTGHPTRTQEPRGGLRGGPSTTPRRE